MAEQLHVFNYPIGNDQARELVEQLVQRLVANGKRAVAVGRFPHEKDWPAIQVLEPSVESLADDINLFRNVAQTAQRLARHFGDRQNSESKLTEREAQAVVTALLNAGNLLQEAAQRAAASCSTQNPSSPAPTSTTQSASGPN